MYSFHDKTVLITGGNGRLGSAFARAFVEAGARVTVWDVAGDAPAGCRFDRCDITQHDAVAAALQRLTAEVGPVQVLINNAYPRNAHYGRTFEDIALADWNDNVAMHLGGYFNVAQQVAQGMREQGGSIVNISSIYGVVGPDFSIYDGTAMTMPAEYAAIKGGIVNFTRYLATWLAKYRIRVNAVSPGGIHDQQDSRFVAAYERRVPLGRMATPDDVVGPVLFLASESARYITGQNLMVDGGWTAW